MKKKKSKNKNSQSQKGLTRRAFIKTTVAQEQHLEQPPVLVPGL